MDPITQQTALASAGGKKDPVYVDDVFSTYLYDGTGSARSINNGIDLSGEGGLVWIKNRESGFQDPALFDTERGAGQTLNSASSGAQFLSTARLSAFNSNGFTVGTDSGTNQSGNGIVSWSFRKAPGFFDVVTYTGTGSVRTIAHNLGSKPGMIITKCLSNSYQWGVYHQSMGATKSAYLNGTGAFGTASSWWNNTEPTSTVFTLGTEVQSNGNGLPFVAYLFASDDASFGTDEDESIIKCGSYAGNNQGGLQTVDVGFEPQFVLIKNSTTNSDSWFIFDSMRGAADNNVDQPILQPNNANAETSPAGGGLRVFVTNNGFGWRDQTGNNVSGLGNTFIYMAIRRPNKPPTAATEVFAMDTYGGTSPSPPTYYSGFPVDFVLQREINSSSTMGVSARLTGSTRLRSAEDYTELSDTSVKFDQQNGFKDAAGTLTAWQAWMFKRAPGFMDVIAYSGTGSNYTSINHGLGVVPEMFIIKRRNSAGSWAVYHKDIGAAYQLYLNTNAAKNSGDLWQDTGVPTSTQFFTHNRTTTNASGSTYVGYFFATLPGISKVGSYTGNGGVQTIDCGFTTGARFVLIKQTDDANDWRLFDTLRGIGAGNDPVLSLNTSAAQDPNKNWLEADSTGFKVNTTNDNVNRNNYSYIFLAIA